MTPRFSITRALAVVAVGASLAGCVAYPGVYVDGGHGYRGGPGPRAYAYDAPGWGGRGYGYGYGGHRYGRGWDGYRGWR